METVLFGSLASLTLAIIGLLFKEFNRKLNCKVNRELCDERNRHVNDQLEKQEVILLRTEQAILRIEKKLAYLNGERKHEPDHD
jgi:hypothetical protein